MRLRGRRHFVLLYIHRLASNKDQIAENSLFSSEIVLRSNVNNTFNAFYYLLAILYTFKGDVKSYLYPDQ